jgi:uncharacterized protein (TIRG00374 family)
VLRFVVGLALAAAALWVVGGHRDELQGLSTVLAHIHWVWLVLALVAEVASLVAFAGMQQRLLEAGGIRAPAGPLVAMTVAAQAMNNSLPGGAAFAAVYGFRWYRRFGATDAIAGWTLVGAGVAAALSLALLAAAGAAVAAELGASLGLVPVIIGVLAVTIAVAALFVYERPLALAVNWGVRVCRRLTGRPHGDVVEQIDRVIDQITVVRLNWRSMGEVLGWGLANWILDCACFAMTFLAIGAPIPWKGLLLAYGAGQLAANVPITPGGLGAVEGSITIALVFFGGSRTTTVDAVLIYRLISFWLVTVVGWLAWGALVVGIHRGRWDRSIRPRPAAPALVGAHGVAAGGRATTPVGVEGGGR